MNTHGSGMHYGIMLKCTVTYRAITPARGRWLSYLKELAEDYKVVILVKPILQACMKNLD